MSPDRLIMREDPSAFEVMDLHEYFQDFTNFIGIEIAIGSFFQANQEKQANGNFNSNKIFTILKIFMQIHDLKSQWVFSHH